MEENEIVAFGLPSWEKYRDYCVKNNMTIEGIEIYEHYHARVKRGLYSAVGLVIVPINSK